MKNILSIFACVIFSCANAQSINNFNSYLKASNQVVFVKTKSDSAIHGMMFLYERKNAQKQWRVIDSFKIIVGRNGLGKDAASSIILNNIAQTKHEGDGKSPAGIFKLGKIFSYHKLQHLKMPFVQVDTNFYCVDDVASSYYNTLIRQDTSNHNFNSFEYMRRRDSLYEYGIWVLYNSKPVINGNGSCIFLHIWNDENSPTSGCTAMAKENLLELTHWLNVKKDPVLLQIAGYKK